MATIEAIEQVTVVEAMNEMVTVELGAPCARLGIALQSSNLSAGPTHNLVVTDEIGFLDLNANAGAASLTGITAGYDGQIITVTSRNAVNNITLNRLNVGSAAANRIRLSADLVLSQDQGISLRYSTALALWIPMS